MKSLSILVFAAVAAAAPIAAAEDAGMDRSTMGHGDMAGTASPASKAFMAAMDDMRNGMAMEMTGEPDLDFLRGMIPHHEGAVAMAKAELRYGTDARAKDLARRIVSDQEAEIALMKRMIAERQGPAR